TAQDYNLIPQAYELTERASKIAVEEFTTSASEEDVKNSRVLELDAALASYSGYNSSYPSFLPHKILAKQLT
ncbi:hypothetical protein BGZ99_002665, partial [Dissophora globulifera]